MKLQALFEEPTEFNVTDYRDYNLTRNQPDAVLEPIKDPFPSHFGVSSLILTSLKGCPTEINGDFGCQYNPKLKSLEYAPKIIHGDFNLFDTGMTSLKGIHEHIHQIDGTICLTRTAYNCEFKSHMLGLLLIKNLKSIDGAISKQDKFFKVANIINKYLPEGDVFECQEELVNAGFAEYAQL